MQGNYQNSGKQLSCHEFDALLADALDGVMEGQELADFRAHAEACANCGPLFTQAQAGMQWLKVLPEVEPPARLVHNILAATSMREIAVAPGMARDGRSWLARVSDWVSPSLTPFVTSAMQPRYAMTAAAAFFSITMLLNVAGFRLKDLRHMDLRPSAISTSASIQYHETTAKMVKYYENMRIVYRLQSQWEQIKRSTDESENERQNDRQRKNKKRNDSNEQRESQQNRNYVPEQGQIQMAQRQLEELEVTAFMQYRRDS